MLTLIVPIGMSEVFAELTVVETASRAEVALQDWYDDSWEFRKNITLSLNTGTGVDSDLTDFPVLISFTDTDLIQTNESLGRDFVFTESDGTTVLSHEIEKFDNTTGEIIAWVKLPTMSASTSTEMYIYYKGDTIGFNSANVWNDDYVIVWHLNQTSTGTAGEFRDATSNGNDGRGGGGTKVGYSAGRIPHDTTGQIGNGQELKGPTTTGTGEGSGDIIWTNGKIQGMPSRDVTIELWVGDITNTPSGGNDSLHNDLVGFCTTHTNDANNNWSNHLTLWRAGNVKMKAVNQFYVSTTDPGHPVDDDNPASFTNWNHIVAVYNMKDADGTQGNSQLYINGELVKDQNRSGNLNHVIKTSDLRMVLGGDVDGANNNNCAKVNNELKGKVDELRISSGLRTASYAAASYFNQGDPDTYTTVNVEETQIEKKTGVSGGCGFDRDCTPPRITNHGESETPDGFSINDNVFEENQERFNKNPTMRLEVGEPVNVTIRTWENMGTDRISLAIAYLGMHGEKPDWRDSKANVEFRVQQDEFKVYDKDKIFSAVGVQTEKVTDPYGDNPALELLDITFTLIFAKPMEPSHVGIQTIDDTNNYDLTYFDAALEILPKEIVEVEEVPEIIPEEVPEIIPEEVPEEFVPEPEPPVKEPEPEVMFTASTEKTVLEFVDENMPAKHYVKRYITETEYREWFDVNYSEYQFWEGIGITQERFDQIVLEIQSEPEPRIIETGFVLVPDNQKSFPLVEETFESEPVELEPVKEKKGFFDWLFALFG
ncbi:DUF2341 domain-containing protein [Candidatus Nitrosopelagicus sp.]|nr:DUF2341 domain-containing protein [Candidatus Nitrosopelagicus sp.]